MSLTLDLVLIAIGIGLLVPGGNLLVSGSLALAKRAKVSPFLAGLVIVGFGTSSPELMVSLLATLQGESDLAIGNVVGSNIGNVLLILGLSALIYPLKVMERQVRIDSLILILVTGIYLLFAFTGQLTRGTGALFLVALAGYLYISYRVERGHATEPEAGSLGADREAKLAHAKTGRWRPILLAVGGLVLLVGGSRVLLLGATSLATDIGLSEAVIGLTIVAIGTSIPELAVSLTAAFRKQADVAVGNIIGSNVFNLMGILGLCALISPLEVSNAFLGLDAYVLLGTSVALGAFAATGMRINRLEGAILMIAYGGYLGSLV